MVCENCGKPMSEHDAMAHCWPDPTTRLREALAARCYLNPHPCDDSTEPVYAFRPKEQP